MIIKNVYIFDGGPLASAVNIQISSDGTVGGIGENLSGPQGEHIIDGKGMIALPGITDAHRHNWQAPFDGFAADMLLMEYLDKVNSQIADRLSADDLYYISLYGYLQAARSGISTVFDWSHIMNSREHADAALAAAEASAINVLFFHSTPSFDREKNWYNSTAGQDRDVERIAKAYAGHKTVRIGLGMRGPEFSALEVNREDLELAGSLGVKASMHVGSSFLGTLCRPVAQLAEAGLLSPDLNLVHCSTLSSEEYAMMAQQGCLVTLTPEAEMQTALGPPAVGFIHGFPGAKWSVGTDIPTGSTPSMLFQQRLALQNYRAKVNQASIDQMAFPETMPYAANDFFFDSSMHANSYAGFGASERIKVGSPANFSLFNWEELAIGSFSLHPVFFYLQEAKIDTVICNGRIIVRDGHAVDHDMAVLGEKIRQILQRIF
jgi:5-methylthioadenosine/S-adenosylhomocysteine deaminase